MGEWCCFHPKEVYVGVCPLCLNERLLILAAKQGLKSSSSAYKTTSFSPSISLPKIFALHRRRKPDHHDHDHDFVDFPDDPDSTSTSFEDESFISIKFGENGEVSWDKSTSNVSKVSLDQSNMPWPSQTSGNHGVNRGNFGNKNVVDPAKPRARPLRWRKGIGHLLHVIKWRRSNRANGGGGEGIVIW